MNTLIAPGDMLVQDMPIPTRARYALMSEHIYTAADLCNRSSKDLLQVPRLGVKGLASIVEHLRENGLELNDDEFDTRYAEDIVTSITDGEPRDVWLAKKVSELPDKKSRAKFLKQMAEELQISTSRVRQLIERGSSKNSQKQYRRCMEDQKTLMVRLNFLKQRQTDLYVALTTTMYHLAKISPPDIQEALGIQSDLLVGAFLKADEDLADVLGHDDPWINP